MDQENNDAPRYVDIGAAVAPSEQLHPALLAYSHTHFYNTVRRRADLLMAYCYRTLPIFGNEERRSTGLDNRLRGLFYPGFNPNRDQAAIAADEFEEPTPERKSRVKTELAHYIANGVHNRAPLAETAEVIDYLETVLGHTLQAANLPTNIRRFTAIAQASCVSRDVNGALHMWLIKVCSRTPIHDAQGGFAAAPLTNVDNTLANQWRMQCHLIQESLRDAGIPIAESAVLCISRRQRPAAQRGAAVHLRVDLDPWTLRLTREEITPEQRERAPGRAKRVNRNN